MAKHTPDTASDAAPRRTGASAKPKRGFAERGGKLMTPDEAGNYLGVTERQIRRLAHEGKLPFVYVGSLVRLDIDDLDAFIERWRIAPRNA